MPQILEASLREKQHPLIRNLANCIETVWREKLDLFPYQIPEGLGYVEGALEGERLIIENHCYSTPQFRKIHLELAQVGNGLDILHCVMFPNAEYDIPIFGSDLVGSRAGISAAIADLSPLYPDFALPPSYHQALSNLPKVNFLQPRELPQWGDIFSQFCLFIRPIGDREELDFLDRVRSILTLHCQLAVATTPFNTSEEINKIRNGHRYYCRKQQQNDKTRRVLAKSFGEEWTERYMTTMLFDYFE